MSKPFLFGLLVSFFSSVLLAQSSTQPLFLIERTQSHNKVYYEARIGKDGSFEKKDPVHAYWILWDKDSSGKTREELNMLERERAYGVKIQRNPAADSFQLAVAAFPKRLIRVSLQQGKVIATINIGGYPCRIEKVFIHNCPDCLIPKVYYAEIFGADLKTGEKRCEKILPHEKS